MRDSSIHVVDMCINVFIYVIVMFTEVVKVKYSSLVRFSRDSYDKGVSMKSAGVPEVRTLCECERIYGSIG